MMKIRHIRGTWFARKFTNMIHADAVTLYPFILYKYENPLERLRKHEMVHVEQIRRIGVFRFYLSYTMFYHAGRIAGWGHGNAYKKIPWEIEARLKETQ